jgi:hypothetical protein
VEARGQVKVGELAKSLLEEKLSLREEKKLKDS